MNNHKATPEQWQASEKRAANGHITDLRILELRSRIEQLEAQANPIGDSNKMVPPKVATDEELGKTYRNSVGCNPDRFRAIYNLGIEHGQASSREVAEPAPVAGGLVARMIYAICGTNDTWIDWSPEARAAILEAAKWLREQGWKEAADLLEQEAGR